MDNNTPIFLPEDTQLPPVPPKPPLRAKLQQLLRKKNILLGLGIVAFLSMGTFIAVSPAHETNTIVAQSFNLPTATPTPLPPTPTTVSTPIPAEPTITPTPRPTTIPTPTIIPPNSWKTFSSYDDGYSIKYPPDWTVKNLGEIEPKIPSYVIFNDPTASSGARSITISLSTRTYAEQLALAASSSAITVAGINGTRQYFQDSDGNISKVITLPRTNTVLVLRAKAKYYSIFDFMLSTLKITTK